jgi:hypothetical protein
MYATWSLQSAFFRREIGAKVLPSAFGKRAVPNTPARYISIDASLNRTLPQSGPFHDRRELAQRQFPALDFARSGVEREAMTHGPRVSARLLSESQSSSMVLRTLAQTLVEFCCASVQECHQRSITEKCLFDLGIFPGTICRGTCL